MALLAKLVDVHIGDCRDAWIRPSNPELAVLFKIDQMIYCNLTCQVHLTLIV
jgi:hypothetical protein